MQLPEKVCTIAKLCRENNGQRLRLDSVQLCKINAEVSEATITDGKTILSVRWNDPAPLDQAVRLPRKVVSFLRVMLNKLEVKQPLASIGLTEHLEDNTLSAKVEIPTESGKLSLDVPQAEIQPLPLKMTEIRDTALAREVASIKAPLLEAGTIPPDSSLEVGIGIPAMMALFERLTAMNCVAVKFFFPLINHDMTKPIGFRAYSEYPNDLHIAGCIMGCQINPSSIKSFWEGP